MYGNVTLYVIPAEQAGQKQLYPMAKLLVHLRHDAAHELREKRTVGNLTTRPLDEAAVVCDGKNRRFRDNEMELLPVMSREDALHLVADHGDRFCAPTVGYLDRVEPGCFVVIDWPNE